MLNRPNPLSSTKYLLILFLILVSGETLGKNNTTLTRFISPDKLSKADKQYYHGFLKKVCMTQNTMNEPFEHKGIYGTSLISVGINRKGHVIRIMVIDPKGNKVLNEYFKKIIRIASPFAKPSKKIMRGNHLILLLSQYRYSNLEEISDFSRKYKKIRNIDKKKKYLDSYCEASSQAWFRKLKNKNQKN